jgi:hypothetical protein
VIGPDVALRMAHEDAVIVDEHRLLAPTLFRSQLLSMLYQAVRRGEMTKNDADRYWGYVRGLEIRLLGDRVLQKVAWKVADQDGGIMQTKLNPYLSFRDNARIADTVNLLRYEDLHDVMLVGYSYAGNVFAGQSPADLKKSPLNPDPGDAVALAEVIEQTLMDPASRSGRSIVVTALPRGQSIDVPFPVVTTSGLAWRILPSYQTDERPPETASLALPPCYC